MKKILKKKILKMKAGFLTPEKGVCIFRKIFFFFFFFQKRKICFRIRRREMIKVHCCRLSSVH